MRYSVKVGEQSYMVEIEDLKSRPVIASVDGERVEVWPEEEVVAVPSKTGSSHMIEAREVHSSPVPMPQAGSSPRTVTAPIPGTIVEIKTANGQSVNRGDELCVLEAMKMKNSIKAARAGVIVSVQVAVGDQVRHGQILMEYAE